MSCNQEGAMDIDLPINVGPTEETVDALLEYLVGPLLSLKHSPSEAQQESVAKQVHAAAVLYNYFHLNHHRESQFLNFDQFCNLAIMFKPSILHHMKYMCQSDRPILDDPENQLSLTEKAIMDACIMSETLLNALDDMSNIIKEWSITKVAVLLTDSKKENCFLKLNDGVWSVIEKDLYPESKKRKRTIINHDDDGEAWFQKLAFSAVQEATGNVNGELKVLESHIVYSLNQAKTATLFYIVQSNQSSSEVDLVPIQDVICSLQGPVVKESLGSWEVTPVVEYYYLLSYAEIISKLFSRVSNSLPHQVEKINSDANIFQGSQKSCEKVSGETKKVSVDFQIKSKLDSESVRVSDSGKEEPRDSKFTKNIFKSNNSLNDDVWLIACGFDQEVKETKQSSDNGVMGTSSDCTKKDMNESCRVESNNSSCEANSKSIDRPTKVYRHEKKSTPTNSIGSKENLKNLKKLSIISQSNDERIDGENKSHMVSPNMDRTLIVNHALEDFNSIVDVTANNANQKRAVEILELDASRDSKSEFDAVQSVVNRMISDGLIKKGDALWLFAMDIFENDVKRKMFLSIPDDEARLIWLQHKQTLGT